MSMDALKTAMLAQRRRHILESMAILNDQRTSAWFEKVDHLLFCVGDMHPKITDLFLRVEKISDWIDGDKWKIDTIERQTEQIISMIAELRSEIDALKNHKPRRTPRRGQRKAKRSRS